MGGKEEEKVCLASLLTQGYPIYDIPLSTDITQGVWATPDTEGRLRLDDP